MLVTRLRSSDFLLWSPTTSLINPKVFSDPSSSYFLTLPRLSSLMLFSSSFSCLLPGLCTGVPIDCSIFKALGLMEPIAVMFNEWLLLPVPEFPDSPWMLEPFELLGRLRGMCLILTIPVEVRGVITSWAVFVVLAGLLYSFTLELSDS